MSKNENSNELIIMDEIRMQTISANNKNNAMLNIYVKKKCKTLSVIKI